MHTVFISSSFRVTIPKSLRVRLQLRPGSKLRVLESAGGLHLTALPAAASLRGIARGIATAMDRDSDRDL